MIVLDNAGTRALSLINTQNGANVEVNFSDYTTTTGVYARGVPTLTTISSGTTTSICATPAASTIRDIDYVNIYNTYAGSQNFTVQITSGSGGPFILVFATLAQNESLNYTHGTGWCALDANGNRKVSLGTILASLTVTGNATVGGTLGVTGATTLAALSATTGAFSAAISGTGADNNIILSQNGSTQWRINNSNAGTGATANLLLQNGTATAGVYLPGTGYTSVGAFAASAAILYGNNAAGVALVADAGPVKIAANGTTAIGTFSSTGLAVTGTFSSTGIGGIGAATSATTNLNLAAGTTGVSTLRIPHGSAPSAPVDGDMWTTTAGLYIRINGGTVGPLS